MRRSETSRAWAFSAAVTVLAPRPLPGPEFCGFWVPVFWMPVFWVFEFWVFVSGGAKCLLDSAGGRPAPGGARGPSLRLRLAYC